MEKRNQGVKTAVAEQESSVLVRHTLDLEENGRNASFRLNGDFCKLLEICGENSAHEETYPSS
jgi:hypothetical protein